MCLLWIQFETTLHKYYTGTTIFPTHKKKTLFFFCFSESENYELVCPSRLDKLIQQAKELECNLKKQKDLLHRRLKLISDTLRMI